MSARAGGKRPVLMVVIDTEEERTWGSYSRSDVSVSAMRRIDRAQRVFDEFGIVPTYVVDYPVASQAEGYEPLREISRSGRATIGAHLHPWVNPPFAEEITPPNTYPGNLPAELEHAKIQTLSSEIARNFGELPSIYKAGRYGLGSNTAAALDRLGFTVDLSTSPGFDLRGDGGPDFRRHTAAPYWLNERVLELPTTGGFAGLFEAAGPWLHDWLAQPALRWCRAAGIASRLGLLDRSRLSPEGHSFPEHKKLTESLLAGGLEYFTWSFHSPSVAPGGTPYVQTETEAEKFLDANRRYFEYFLGTLDGVPMTPVEVRDRLSSLRNGNPA